MVCLELQLVEQNAWIEASLADFIDENHLLFNIMTFLPIKSCILTLIDEDSVMFYYANVSVRDITRLENADAMVWHKTM